MAPVSTADPRRAVEGDDLVVIADCLAGKTAAFGALVGRYQDRLYNTVFRLVDNAEDALDVVQEAFLSAYQSLESFKGDSQFFTWLYRIAVNTAISHKRKRRVVARIDGRNGEAALDPLDPSAHGQPGHALERAEEEQRVHGALARLSPEHRAVLVMKELDGLKYEEIAEALRVPIGTVRSRLHRARLELRELFEQDEK
jgi:RNA polymerase sigma-70 factor, ECF subfamily